MNTLKSMGKVKEGDDQLDEGSMVNTVHYWNGFRKLTPDLIVL